MSRAGQAGNELISAAGRRVSLMRGDTASVFLIYPFSDDIHFLGHFLAQNGCKSFRPLHPSSRQHRKERGKRPPWSLNSLLGRPTKHFHFHAVGYT